MTQMLSTGGFCYIFFGILFTPKAWGRWKEFTLDLHIFFIHGSWVAQPPPLIAVLFLTCPSYIYIATSDGSLPCGAARTCSMPKQSLSSPGGVLKGGIPEIMANQ